MLCTILVRLVKIVEDRVGALGHQVVAMFPAHEVEVVAISRTDRLGQPDQDVGVRSTILMLFCGYQTPQKIVAKSRGG